jgi:hypothetical protein
VHGDKFELRNALHCHTPTVGGNQKQIDMKRIVTFLMILALLSCEKEDNIDKENDNWFKIFTSGNSLSKVIKDWDDSYVLAGNVNVYNTTESFVMKLDNSGNSIWESSFGSNGFDNVIDVVKTAPEYLTAGYTMNEDNNIKNFLVASIDIRGNVHWRKNYYRGIANSVIWAYSEDYSGEYYNYTGDYLVGGTFEVFDSVNGYYRNNLSVLKIDNQGDIIWQFIHSDETNCYDIVRDSDDSYMIVGDFMDSQYLNSSVFLLKLDSKGKKVWEKHLLLSENSDKTFDRAKVVLKVNDGFLIGANSDVNNYFENAGYIIKISSQGDVIWKKKLSDNFELTDIAVDGNNYFAVGKELDESNRDFKTKFIRTDKDGNVVGLKSTFLNQENYDDNTSSILIDNEYLILGGNATDDGYNRYLYLKKIKIDEIETWIAE